MIFFDNNVEIKNDFTKYLNVGCWLFSDYHFYPLCQKHIFRRSQWFPDDSTPVILVLASNWDEEPALNIFQQKYDIRTVINNLIDRKKILYDYLTSNVFLHRGTRKVNDLSVAQSRTTNDKCGTVVN